MANRTAEQIEAEIENAHRLIIGLQEQLTLLAERIRIMEEDYD